MLQQHLLCKASTSCAWYRLMALQEPLIPARWIATAFAKCCVHGQAECPGRLMPRGPPEFKRVSELGAMSCGAAPTSI